MSKFKSNQVIRTNLDEHPSVRAWSELRPDRVQPEAITILKEREDNKWNNKSALYRLHGVGPAGTAVVA